MSGQAKMVGSSKWDPDEFMKQWALQSQATPGAPSKLLPVDNNLEASIRQAFGLPARDTYVYHAMVSVTLAQVQAAINAGDRNGMHAWYLDSDGNQITPPPQADIDAYASVFLSTTNTTAALKGLASNAKKGSIRLCVAENLSGQRVFLESLKIPKHKAANAHVNPYLDYWAWSCRTLEWAGPDATTVNVRISHHILPVLYHHFGCVCPTFEAIEAMRQLSRGRPVIELGSGNGYWAYLLRRAGLSVAAVDNGDSLWRTMWIGDTVKEDGKRYLQRHGNGKDAVLLLVYPQVTTSFTAGVLSTYAGDTICVAGTQNANGFTAFKDQTIDAFMASSRPEFEKMIQTPLPSFAAKDEAFFVFERRK